MLVTTCHEARELIHRRHAPAISELDVTLRCFHIAACSDCHGEAEAATWEPLARLASCSDLLQLPFRILRSSRVLFERLAEVLPSNLDREFVARTVKDPSIELSSCSCSACLLWTHRLTTCFASIVEAEAGKGIFAELNRPLLAAALKGEPASIYELALLRGADDPYAAYAASKQDRPSVAAGALPDISDLLDKPVPTAIPISLIPSEGITVVSLATPAAESRNLLGYGHPESTAIANGAVRLVDDCLHIEGSKLTPGWHLFVARPEPFLNRSFLPGRGRIVAVQAATPAPDPDDLQGVIDLTSDLRCVEAWRAARRLFRGRDKVAHLVAMHALFDAVEVAADDGPTLVEQRPGSPEHFEQSWRAAALDTALGAKAEIEDSILHS